MGVFLGTNFFYHFNCAVGDTFQWQDRTWCIDKNLGCGVSGVIWRVHTQDAGEKLVRVFKQCLSCTGEDSCMQKEEYRILKDLQKEPSIIRVYALTSFQELFPHLRDQSHCLFMDYLGESMLDLLKRVKMKTLSGLGIGRVQIFARAVFEQLGALKRSGVVHADGKPANWCWNNGEPKLIDYGLAATRQDFDEDTFWEQYTFEYRPPEKMYGLDGDLYDEDPNNIYAADMWAAGCTLFELFTGKMLFGATPNWLHLLRLKQPSQSDVINATYFYRQLGSFGLSDIVNSSQDSQMYALNGKIIHDVDELFVQKKAPEISFAEKLPRNEDQLEPSLRIDPTRVDEANRDFCALLKGLLVLNPRKRCWNDTFMTTDYTTKGSELQAVPIHE